MGKFSTSIFLLCFAALSFSQQQKRGEDGNLFTEATPVQTTESKLCGKTWTWIEGIEGNQKFESAVFSFRYEKDGTFTYNQRSEKNYWKIEGNFLIHSVLPFDIKGKQKFGIFSGKYEISKITDSSLTLTKVNGDKNNPATVLKMDRDFGSEKIEISAHTSSNSNKLLNGRYPVSEIELPSFMDEKNELHVKGNTTNTKLSDGYLNSLRGRYPTGVTEETQNFTGVLVTRRIVVKEKNVCIYERVQNFDSQEISFLKNGESSTPEIFDSETVSK